MKLIGKYYDIGVFSEDDAFGYLISNLRNTIRTYDFYVAWKKVLSNVCSVEIALNVLNSLIGKPNVEEMFKNLIVSYPEVVPVLPILIAVRDKSIKVADIGGDIEYSFSRKERYSEDEANKIVYFAAQCGLLKILSDKNVKNLVDYCIGVEVGLDTNARKNRSGTAMENLTEIYVKAICDKYRYHYITQATVAQIKAEFGHDVPTDKSDRHFDFAIYANDKIYLLEVNYYGDGGSKLKSVAGEFKALYKLVKQVNNIEFIWVTDGQGWRAAHRPLRETYNAINYVLNLKLIEDGLMEDIITKGL